MDQQSELSWESVRQLLDEGRPALRRLSQDPAIDLFVETAAARLGIWVAVSEVTDKLPHPLAEVSVRLVSVEGRRVLEIATETAELFAEFFSFALTVVSLVRDVGLEPVRALNRALQQWHALLKPLHLLTEERQIGLWGELWVLKRAVGSRGPIAVEAWTGPLGEPHDFRVQDDEFEVKTTSAARRVHTINGLQQLLPSLGKRLFLISVQVEPSGLSSGDSLPDQVKSLRDALNADARLAGVFEERLECEGYFDEDASFYGERWSIRNETMIISADSCPRIIPSTVATVDEGWRLEEVTYRVNVEGLGQTLSGAFLSADSKEP